MSRHDTGSPRRNRRAATSDIGDTPGLRARHCRSIRVPPGLGASCRSSALR
jgi:hypothetical protein